MALAIGRAGPVDGCSTSVRVLIGCFLVEGWRVADCDQEALGTQQACRDLPPRLGFRVVNQPIALPGQLCGRVRHIRHLELDARLWDWDVIGPIRRAEARHGCLPKRPQAEMLGTRKSFRELVVGLASLKAQAERALVEVTRRHVVTNYRRDACEELYVHRFTSGRRRCSARVLDSPLPAACVAEQILPAVRLDETIDSRRPPAGSTARASPRSAPSTLATPSASVCA